MISPAELAAGLRAHAQGLYCLEAAAELLIAKSWLHRDDFTSRFVTLHLGIGSGQLMTVIDWPAVIAALGSSLPCSGGEQRMLKITASPADGIPVDLQDTLTSLGKCNTGQWGSPGVTDKWRWLAAPFAWGTLVTGAGSASRALAPADSPGTGQARGIDEGCCVQGYARCRCRGCRRCPDRAG